MVNISSTDPVYVTFSLRSADFVKLLKASDKFKDVEVKIQFSDGNWYENVGVVNFVVKASSYACFGNIKWVIDGSLINGVWNIVRKDANGGYTLNALTITATSADGSPVDVYMGGFQVNTGAYA